MAIGNKYQHHILTRAQFEQLSPSSDSLYFVAETDGRISLYKGSVLVSNSFFVVASLPSAGILGRLYLNTADGLFWYYTGTAWKRVAEKVVTTQLSGASSDEEVPSAKLVWTTMQSIIAEAVSGVAGAVHPPVQSLTELAALDDMTDKMVCLAEDTGALYRYDAESSATADGDAVIAPVSGSGRWIKVRGSLAVNSTYFVWNGEQLTLNPAWVGTLGGSDVALTNDVPVALAATASAGTATTAARADHVHPTTGLALDEDVRWHTY